jgi:hypothetical protein
MRLFSRAPFSRSGSSLKGNWLFKWRFWRIVRITVLSTCPMCRVTHRLILANTFENCDCVIFVSLDFYIHIKYYTLRLCLGRRRRRPCLCAGFGGPASDAVLWSCQRVVRCVLCDSVCLRFFKVSSSSFLSRLYLCVCCVTFVKRNKHVCVEDYLSPHSTRPLSWGTWGGAWGAGFGQGRTDGVAL